MEDDDCCMHVDGAGVVGMKNLPYYPESLTSEPAGHDCLSIKNTFAKIHGFGRVIFQSYPVVEKQGANLIVEIILRSLVIFMRHKEKRVLRKLNVFFDNTSVNKCFTIIAAMASLVLLGILYVRIIVHCVLILKRFHVMLHWYVLQAYVEK